MNCPCKKALPGLVAAAQDAHPCDLALKSNPILDRKCGLDRALNHIAVYDGPQMLARHQVCICMIFLTVAFR